MQAAFSIFKKYTTICNRLAEFPSCMQPQKLYYRGAMNRYMYTLVCAVLFVTTLTYALPTVVDAQATTTTQRKAPRKYDKLLTAVESFAKLNAQIDIREREFTILSPFVNDVLDYANQLQRVCDAKCNRSLNTYSPKLQKFNAALLEANRRYMAMTPDITQQNTALMSEIQRVEFLPVQLNKDKDMAALNQLNLENLYHYKAYNNTYHSADTAMLSLASSSDLTLIVNSFASTTDRLVTEGRAQQSMSGAIANLKNKVPDIRTRIKALEDKRKSLVCTATLQQDYGVDAQCLP